MTKSQELQIKMSEKREQLNALIGIETGERTEEQTTEMTKLSAELSGHEAEFRAALATEASEQAEAKAEAEKFASRGRAYDSEEDQETRELRGLQTRVSLGGYLEHFMAGSALDTPYEELAEARGIDLGTRTVPWDVLLPPATDPDRPRTSAVQVFDDAPTPAPATGNPVNQADIIDRVFARSYLGMLGVDRPSVPNGAASYPVLATGQTPSYPGTDGEKEAVAGSITPHALSPERLEARFQYRLQDALTMRGLDASLRRDLRASMVSQQDAQIMSAGDAQVRGFLATPANGGLNAGTAPGANVVTFPEAARQAAAGVDGIYAGSEAELVWIVGTKVYEILGGLIQSNDSTSATERLRRLLRGFQASAHLPAPAANIASGILAKVGVLTRTAVAPVWEGLMLIPDNVTAAKQGRVNLTAVAFHNFAVLQPNAYIRTLTRVAA